MMTSMAGVAASASALSAGSVAGRESGGPVTEGTPYIVGEAGHELFVPSQSGYIMPHNALGNLRGNLAAHAAQVGRLQAQTGGYASSARAAAEAGGGTHVHLEGATIIGSDHESARIIGNLVRAHQDSYNRRRG
jgi:hypothetical protein